MLVAMRLEEKRTFPQWIAVWRTSSGNFIHDTLPAGINDEPTAWIYALDNAPSWSKAA